MLLKEDKRLSESLYQYCYYNRNLLFVMTQWIQSNIILLIMFIYLEYYLEDEIVS